MARITVEDCLAREENRFALVVLASKRARQLLQGAKPKTTKKGRSSVTALREIADGKVQYDKPVTEVVNNFITYSHALEESRRNK